MRPRTRIAAGVLAISLALLAAACGGGKGAIKIGVLADCEGILAPFYESTLGGAELPLLSRGGSLSGSKPSDGVKGVEVGGRPVELFFGCAGEPTEAATEARRLVEHEGADVLVGADYTPNGSVLVDYSHRRQATTFVITSDRLEVGKSRVRMSSASGSTSPSRVLGWVRTPTTSSGVRNAMTLSGVDPSAWPERAGIVAEFCALGGKVVDEAWLDTLQENIPARIAEVSSTAADGFIVMTTDSTSAGVFLTRYGKREPVLSQKVIAVGSALFGLERAVAAQLGDQLVGMVTSSEADPATASVSAPMPRCTSAPSPSSPAPPRRSSTTSTLTTETAWKLSFRQSRKSTSDCSSDGQQRFRQALARVELDAPQGRIHLDGNRQAVGPVYLRQVVRNDGGTLRFRTIRTLQDVDASFGGHFGPGDPRPDRTHRLPASRESSRAPGLRPSQILIDHV